MNPETLDALATAQRLQTLGITIRSPELEQEARRLIEFRENGGNRAMRRHAAKQLKKRRRT